MRNHICCIIVALVGLTSNLIAQEVIPLWPDGVPNSRPSDEVENQVMGDDGVLRIHKVQEPAITVYPAPAENNTGRSVVICPGGGYGIQAANIEGTAVAEWLNSIGVTGIVLKYRLPGSASVVERHEAPLQDAQRAIRLTRSRAQTWKLSPDKIGIMGFSAGGHLASTAATHFDTGDPLAADPIERVSCRPDFAILVYPVISFQDETTHRGSRSNLLGENPDPELIDYFSNEMQVTEKTPPTFLVHGNDDTSVPVENSVAFYNALIKNNVPAELHIFKHGRHGFGLGRFGGEAKAWPDLCSNWFETLSYIRLATVFGDNMVLQRGMEVPVWGWGEPGDEVTVQMLEKTYRTSVDGNGRWQISLPPMQAGGPHSMSIEGRNSILLRNILIGDVWVCGGQSNMEWQVNRSNNAEEEIASANFPEIRLFNVEHRIATRPVQDVKSTGWHRAVGEHIRNFSAVGYFFGRELHGDMKIPIGLISNNWGGTNAETWTSSETMKQLPDFKDRVEEYSKDPRSVEQLELDIAKARKTWEASVEGRDPGMQNGTAVWAQTELDDSDWLKMELPTLWENAGLKDLDGIVWFRKEVELPATLAGQNILLRIGRIDDSDETWFNGVKVGSISNSSRSQRNYEVPGQLVKAGRNVIAVRVRDTGGGGGIWGIPERLAIHSEADDYQHSLAGTWKYKIALKTDQQVARGVGPNDRPSLLFNGMLKPTMPYGIKGAIWYQGESNASRAYQYRELFPAMIEDWRKQWGQGNFPFLFVQLANYMAVESEPGESAWAELREAQSMTLSTPNTGQAVIIDIGEANDIHPRNKQDVGKRLAMAARKVAYGQNTVYSGPVYESMRVNGSKVTIRFKNIGSGLLARDRYGYLKGFAIAGADKKFYWADAIIDGDKVVVSNPIVKKPVAVRYAWANNPDDANLYNAEGLPASPFRTDDWHGITYGKK